MQIPKGISLKSNGKYAIQTMLAGKRLNATTDTLEDAIAVKKQMLDGSFQKALAPNSITISQALNSYVKRRVARSTSDNMDAQKFNWNCKVITDFFGANTYLDDITAAKINLFADHMGNQDWANSTINYMSTILYNAMNDAHERELMTAKPARMKHLSLEEGRIRFLTKDEEHRSIQWLQMSGHTDYSDLFLFYIETGMRKTEALNLKWCDVDLRTRRISIWKTKVNRARTIQMTPMAHDVLQRAMMKRGNQRSDDDEVFAHIAERHFGRTWIEMRNALGMSHDEDFVLNALRHTCCTRLVETGTDLRTVMQWMGHSKLEMTQRYSHFIPKRMDDAVGKLDNLRYNLA
jgi:integrase